MNITIKNLLKYGFFNEHIPQDTFSLDEVYTSLISDEEYFEKISTRLKELEIKSTPCSIFSLYKNESERRMISILHLETYILLSYILEKYNSRIFEKINENNHSQSKEIKPIGEDYSNVSNYKNNLYERIIYSMGYKYLLKLDLSKCYENIYTHAITWALLSKETAKKEFAKKSKNQSEDYKIADQIDCYVRLVNNGETKGIPTGPITSRIVSELILSEIDRILSEKNYHFKRYVDDYKFYFHSKDEIDRFLPIFQKLLYDFKLNINHSKTDIKKYPYETEDALNNELHRSVLEDQGVVAYINKFNNLYNLSYKGALKYGLKVLRKQKEENLFKFNNITKHKSIVLSQLINTLLVRPQMSQLIIEIIQKNNFTLDYRVENTLNTTLKNSIFLGHDAEIIWLIYFLRSFDLKINIDNVVRVLDKKEAISCIYILDYIKIKKLDSDNNIKSAKEKLKIILQKENIYGEKWLLIYECNRKKWIKGIKNNLKTSNFFKKLFEEEVDIYKGITIKN